MCEVLMLKVCLAGKPLRSLIKATSEHTLPFLSPKGWSISNNSAVTHTRGKEEITRKTADDIGR